MGLQHLKKIKVMGSFRNVHNFQIGSPFCLRELGFRFYIKKKTCGEKVFNLSFILSSFTIFFNEIQALLNFDKFYFQFEELCKKSDIFAILVKCTFLHPDLFTAAL